ncbi:ABC transporter ATP-binding protein [Bacillus taeanensis]|uniref:ABC transporter ATP-binding protein n=1 Tax=Bacillus taeanensis TaxID=273032 RepID=A0A366XNI2_9BACI|nr:ABC transporter ATP-binding protein [Bacillus taeanensis]RBW67467.1 ABC transporter ATP-binding protein [Bacillus taeanensis]
MRKIFPFLKPYRITVIAALVLMLTELVVELINPLLIAKIIDDGIMKNDINVILTWGVVMIGLSLLAFLSGIINSFYSSHVSQSFGYDVRQALFQKVQSFSFANFNIFPTSSLITRLTNDITQIQNAVFMGLRIMLRAPLLVIGGTVMALFVNWKIALSIVAAIPILLLLLIAAMKKGGKLFRAVQEKLDTVNSVMQENLAGMRLIKAFLRMQHEVKRFTKANRDLRDRTIAGLRLMEMVMPLLLLVMNASLVAILWFGSMEVREGSVQVGEVVAIINYTLRITAAFSILSFIMMVYTRASTSAGRITEVLEAEVDLIELSNVNASKKITDGKIVFNNVSFHYPHTTSPVLRDLSFTVHSGETAAVLGATGSGKTSLFQLIPRLYDVDEGMVEIDNSDIKEMKLDYLRKQIGFVPQEALLFTGSVKENIAWGKETASMEEIIESAKAAQIHETIMKLPKQYETKIGQKGVNLSGGQKQRLSIARALVRKPKLLLLDDSTSALDLKTEARLLESLQNYQCTTLIITQKISTAMEADTILLLEDGKLLVQGSHEELLNSSALYQQIYDSQFGKGRENHVQGAN